MNRQTSQSAEPHSEIFISEELSYSTPNSMSSNVPELYGSNTNTSYSFNAGPRSSKSDKSLIQSSASGKYLPNTASPASHTISTSQVKNSHNFSRLNSVSELHTSTAANIPATYSNPIDSSFMSRNSGMRSSIASIVSTPQVNCANVTSLNPRKLSPLTHSKTPSSISLNSPMYDNTSLNLHIAKTSVTTLTDTATLESVTRVSESYESYRLPPHLKVSSTPIHSAMNSQPVSIQSDIYISSGSNNVSLTSNRNSGVNISEINDGPSTFSGNNYDSFTGRVDDSTLNFTNSRQTSNSVKSVPTSVKSCDSTESSRDRSLYSLSSSSQSTVSPLQIKSTQVSAVSSAFPLLNIHSNSSHTMPKLFSGPPLTVKPIIASKPEVLNSSPPHLKIRNPPLFLNSLPSSKTRNQSTDSKPLLSNPPLLRLSGKDLKDSPLLHIGNPSIPKQNKSTVNSISQNVDSFISPKISPKSEVSRIHKKENVHSSSQLEANSAQMSSESYTNQIRKSYSQFFPPVPPTPAKVNPPAPHATEISRGDGSTVVQSVVQPGSSQDLDHYNLPKSLSDKVLLRKFGQGMFTKFVACNLTGVVV